MSEINTKIKFFNLTARFYERIHFSKQNKFIKFAQQQNFFCKSDNVLDLAGGTGRISKLIKNKVSKVFVFDASKQMLKQAKKKGLKTVHGLAEEISFPDNYFDKIIIVDAFHHFQNQEKVVKELKRVLKDKGLILIEEVNCNGLFGFLLKIAEKVLLMNSKFLTPKQLSLLLEKNNFKINKQEIKKSFYYLIAEK